MIETRSWHSAVWRGLTKRCPACGGGDIMTAYIKVRPNCLHCAAELHHHRADDAPPYFTMMIVGHTVVPLLVVIEKVWHPPLWVHFATLLPLTLALALWLMPRVKAAIVGLQWALRMHGFSGDTEAVPKT